MVEFVMSAENPLLKKNIEAQYFNQHPLYNELASWVGHDLANRRIIKATSKFNSQLRRFNDLICLNHQPNQFVHCHFPEVNRLQEKLAKSVSYSSIESVTLNTLYDYYVQKNSSSERILHFPQKIAIWQDSIREISEVIDKKQWRVNVDEFSPLKQVVSDLWANSYGVFAKNYYKITELRPLFIKALNNLHVQTNEELGLCTFNLL